eukprot:182341_1
MTTNLINVCIKQLSNSETFNFSINNQQSIAYIKHLIHDQTGMHLDYFILLAKNKILCPSLTLDMLHIDESQNNDEITLYLINKIQSGVIAPSSLLKHIWIQQYPTKTIHNILTHCYPIININNEWSINITKIISEYIPFQNSIDALKYFKLCGRDTVFTRNHDHENKNICTHCNKYFYPKPYIDCQLIKVETDRLYHATTCFTGLWINLEFETYISTYDKKSTMRVDIDAITESNINDYIKIKDEIGNVITFALCHKGIRVEQIKMEETKQEIETETETETEWICSICTLVNNNNLLECSACGCDKLYENKNEKIIKQTDTYTYLNCQFIIIKINADSLKQQRFIQNRLKVNIQIDEGKIPLILSGIWKDTGRGTIIGNSDLEYYVCKSEFM